MSDSFFRPEVLEAKKHRWTGKVVLTRPFSFVFLTGCAALVGCCIILFAFFGSYTRKTTVEGQLMPVGGVVKVYAPEAGVITDKKVNDGDFVQKGDALFTLSTARFNEEGDVQARLAQEASVKQALAVQEVARLSRVHENEVKSLQSSIGRLKSQLADVDNQLVGQRRRVRLAEQVVAKYRPLVKKGFISEQQLMGYEGEMLDQVSRLDMLKREKSGIARELNEQQIALSALPEKQQTETSQLNRTLSGINQELLDFDSRGEQTIRASRAGVVSTGNVEAGQQVDPARLLVSIVPGNTELVANLYVPSKAAGFVKPDDKVVLRYQAFPYQKFGHAEGKIVSVAKTALGKQELESLGLIFSNPALVNEPAYLVKVKLSKQTVKAYGEEKPLQIGMVLEADILHERKRLYEWVLEPLYSISGKWH